NPVLNPDGSPVTAATGPDGTYSFPGVARDVYTVAVDVPPGLELVGPEQLPADATAGDVTGVDFQLTTVTPPTPPVPPTPVPPTPVPPVPPTSAAPLPVAPPTTPTTPAAEAPQLAATGTGNAGQLALVGPGLLALGATLV